MLFFIIAKRLQKNIMGQLVEHFIGQLGFVAGTVRLWLVRAGEGAMGCKGFESVDPVVEGRLREAKVMEFAL